MPEQPHQRRRASTGAVEPVRGARPDDASWRADGLAGSRHQRWTDELREPLENHDLGRATEICAQVCRSTLQDFAPSLMLLPELERLRVQGLTAYCLTLFDFVRQTGLEGERLAAINRWEFDLEAALDGRPPGQPIYVLLHHLEGKRPWNREGFDRLHAYARRRCTVGQPIDVESAERDALALGEIAISLFTGTAPDPHLCRLASALIRLRRLMFLGDDLRRHRPQLAIAELPPSWQPSDSSQTAKLSGIIGGECQRIERLLGRREDLRRVSTTLRPAARYCHFAASRLLDRIELQGTGLIEAPPGLTLADRLLLLLRSRWW